MKYFKDHNLTPGKRLHLLAGCNEESGMGDIKFFLEHEKPPDFSLITDCGFPVCCGEKGHLTFEMAFKIEAGTMISLRGGNAINTVADFCEIVIATNQSRNQFEDILHDAIVTTMAVEGTKIIARGKSAHAAVPEQGVNAISILFEHLNRTFNYAGELESTIKMIENITRDTTGECIGINCEDAASGSLSLSAGMVRLKDDMIVLTLDIRYPVTLDGNEIISKIFSFGAKNCIKIGVLDHSPPFYIDQHDPKVLYLTQIFNKLTGMETQPYTMGGGTHARIMPNALGYGMSVPGTPCLFPPGRGLYHQPDEALYIPSLLKGIKVYIAAIAGIEIV